jgi:tRNA(Ile)-lysidine synthase
MVVAVSGGPDSVALLRALVELRVAADGPLIVAHLNHQLRGPESDGDEAFVAALHATLVTAGATGLQLRCQQIDVAGQARAEGDNLEKVARKVRYAWLAAVAREAGVRLVATAHTANDQAETVLHRLLRGTGLKGLRGIAARRTLAGGIELVRPLLTTTRAEVLAYLEEMQQAHRHDPSNFDLARTRNRIRHELLPHLAECYNPAVVEALGRLARQAAEAYDRHEGDADYLLTRAERPRAGGILVFSRSWLAAAPRRLVREVFRLAWAREGWPLAGMGMDQWDRLAGLAAGESTAADFPGGVRARCRRRVVQIGKA